MVRRRDAPNVTAVTAIDLLPRLKSRVCARTMYHEWERGDGDAPDGVNRPSNAVDDGDIALTVV